MLACLMAAAVGLACTQEAPDPGAQRTPTEETPAEDPSTEDPPPLADSPFAAIPDLVREIGPSTVAIELLIQQDGQTAEGAGSGVIWGSDGYIVTNAHVVLPAEEIVVILADGARHDGQLLAADERTDLAVVRIDATGLPEAVFADELPEIGTLAVALGNPLGFQNTATVGIVSGVDRDLPVIPGAPPLVGLIQTDAAISSGNSGGALIDQAGVVIGINTAVVDSQAAPGVAQGLGFAIPSTTVTPVIQQLIDDGEVAHAHLGIAGAPLTPQLAERFDIDRDRGVLIGTVQPGSPADEAGLQQGDVIVALGDATIDTLGDLLGELRRYAPGDTVDVEVVRDGEERTETAVLGELPEDVPA